MNNTEKPVLNRAIRRGVRLRLKTLLHTTKMAYDGMGAVSLYNFSAEEVGELSVVNDKLTQLLDDLTDVIGMLEFELEEV